MMNREITLTYGQITALLFASAVVILVIVSLSSSNKQEYVTYPNPTILLPLELIETLQEEQPKLLAFRKDGNVDIYGADDKRNELEGHPKYNKLEPCAISKNGEFENIPGRDCQIKGVTITDIMPFSTIEKKNSPKKRCIVVGNKLVC